MKNFILKILFTVIVVSILYFVFKSVDMIKDFFSSVQVCSTENLVSGVKKLTCTDTGFKFAEIERIDIIVDLKTNGYTINDYYRNGKTSVYILNKKN